MVVKGQDTMPMGILNVEMIAIANIIQDKITTKNEVGMMDEIDTRIVAMIVSAEWTTMGDLTIVECEIMTMKNSAILNQVFGMSMLDLRNLEVTVVMMIG